MVVWRLASGRYDPLSGSGARRYGGRWNEAGMAVIYTSAHLSLAVLEKLVHTEPDLLPDDLVAFKIEFPDDVEVPMDWPPAWKENARVCRTIGAQWISSGRTLALTVPSVVVPQEHNLLINPAHPRMAEVRIIAQEPFQFDPRLFQP